MKILLDLEDRPFLFKQLVKLYEELPVGLRSRKSLLPASELIMEAAEYISYLKKSTPPQKNSLKQQVYPPSSTLNDGFINDFLNYLSARHPNFADQLKRTKNKEDLGTLATIFFAKTSPHKTLCVPVDFQTVPPPEVILYKCVRNEVVDHVVRNCNTFNCINPHHFEKSPMDPFVHCLYSRLSPGKESDAATDFFKMLKDKLSQEEIQMIIKGFNGHRKNCFPVELNHFLGGGEIRAGITQGCVQHLLFKTFRYHSSSEEPSIQSTQMCKISRGKTRNMFFCLNPWHFEIVLYDLQKRKKYSNVKDEWHRCDPRLLVTASSMTYICRTCYKNLNESSDLELQDKTDKNFLPIHDNTDSSKSENADSTLPIKIVETTSIIQSKMPDNVYSSEETSSSLKSSQSEKPLPKSKPEKKNTTTLLASPVLRERSTRKRKLQAIFQCWKCLSTFTTNSELEQHSCSNRHRNDDDDDEDVDVSKEVTVRVKKEKLDEEYEVNGSLSKEGMLSPNLSIVLEENEIKKENLDRLEDLLTDRKEEISPEPIEDDTNLLEPDPKSIMYTCQFCGHCSGDLSVMKPHTDKCKRFGLRPLIGLLQIGATHHSNEESDASGGPDVTQNYMNMDGVDNGCSYCGIVFANSSELKLHSTKRKCRSIQCGVCNKFYATMRTHQSHACEGLNLKEADGIVYFKTNSSENKWTPVSCPDCGITVPSKLILYQHQSAQKCTCSRCNNDFFSVCAFLTHPCLKIPIPQEDSQNTAGNSSAISVKIPKNCLNVIDLKQTVPCPQCGKIFINVEALDIHKNRVH